MPEFSFSRDQASVLICLYEKFPNLYEVHSDAYKNRNKRQEALEHILTEYKDIYPDTKISVADIKKKINSIRTQYFSELNKIKKSKASGAAGDDVYKPTLWCFEQLSFLNAAVKIRESESNLLVEVEEFDTNEVEIFDGTLEEVSQTVFDNSATQLPATIINSTPSGSVKKRRIIEDSGNRRTVEKLLEKTSALLEEPIKEPDHIDNFCSMMASEMRQLKNGNVLRQLKRQISNLIFDALDEEATS